MDRVLDLIDLEASGIIKVKVLERMRALMRLWSRLQSTVDKKW